MGLVIRKGISASAQESDFMNSTLQTATGGKLAFSIATHIDIPSEWAADEDSLAAYLAGVLQPLSTQFNVEFEIELGPEDSDA